MLNHYILKKKNEKVLSKRVSEPHKVVCECENWRKVLYLGVCAPFDKRLCSYFSFSGLPIISILNGKQSQFKSLKSVGY